MDSCKRHVVFHIEMYNVGKCLTYIFGYLLPKTFTKDYIFGSNCEKLGRASLPNLVSTDHPGYQYRQCCLSSYKKLS